MALDVFREEGDGEDVIDLGSISVDLDLEEGGSRGNLNAIDVDRLDLSEWQGVYKAMAALFAIEDSYILLSTLDAYYESGVWTPALNLAYKNLRSRYLEVDMCLISTLGAVKERIANFGLNGINFEWYDYVLEELVSSEAFKQKGCAEEVANNVCKFGFKDRYYRTLLDWLAKSEQSHLFKKAFDKCLPGMSYELEAEVRLKHGSLLFEDVGGVLNDSSLILLSDPRQEKLEGLKRKIAAAFFRNDLVIAKRLVGEMESEVATLYYESVPWLVQYKRLVIKFKSELGERELAFEKREGNGVGRKIFAVAASVAFAVTAALGGWAVLNKSNNGIEGEKLLGAMVKIDDQNDALALQNNDYSVEDSSNYINENQKGLIDVEADRGEVLEVSKGLSKTEYKTVFNHVTNRVSKSIAKAETASIPNKVEIQGGDYIVKIKNVYGLSVTDLVMLYLAADDLPEVRRMKGANQYQRFVKYLASNNNDLRKAQTLEIPQPILKLIANQKAGNELKNSLGLTRKQVEYRYGVKSKRANSLKKSPEKHTQVTPKAEKKGLIKSFKGVAKKGLSKIASLWNGRTVTLDDDLA